MRLPMSHRFWCFQVTPTSTTRHDLSASARSRRFPKLSPLNAQKNPWRWSDDIRWSNFYQIAFFSSLPSQSLFHPMIPRLLHSPTCTKWNHHEHFIDRHRRYFPTSPKPRSKSQQFQAWHVKWNRSSLWTSSMYVFTISMYLALLQVFWKTTWNLNLSLCHDVHRLKATQLAGAVLSLPSEVCKAAHDCGVGDGREHETACVGKEDQVERHNSARRIGATATPKQLQHQPTSDSQNC